MFANDFPGAEEVLFIGQVIRVVEEPERIRVAAAIFGGVAEGSGPSAEMDLRRPHFDFGILVAQHVPQDAVGLVAGLVEDGAVGGAHQLAPARGFGVDEAAQFAGAEVEFGRAGFPTGAGGAQFGGDEQRVVEELGAGGRRRGCSRWRPWESPHGGECDVRSGGR